MSKHRKPKPFTAGQRLYLVTPAAVIPGWTFQEDRDYFSNPVPVVVVSDDGETVRVTDPVREHTYPADRSYLKTEWQLTNKQRKLANVVSD